MFTADGEKITTVVRDKSGRTLTYPDNEVMTRCELRWSNN